MSVQAYQKAATRAESPRQVEYRLLGQVTRALMDVQNADGRDTQALIDALDWNRRVWSAFAVDCARDGNAMPEGLRASIVSLSIFVSKHSSAVARSGDEIQPLIDINRAIMQGLAAGGAGEPA